MNKIPPSSKSGKPKSRIGQNLEWAKSELDKVTLGQNPEFDRQNPKLDKIQNGQQQNGQQHRTGQNSKRKKSRMDKILN